LCGKTVLSKARPAENPEAWPRKGRAKGERRGKAKRSEPWSGLSCQTGGLSSRCGGCPREEIRLDGMRCGSYGCGTVRQAGTDPKKDAVLYLAKGPGWKSGTLVFFAFRKTRFSRIKPLRCRRALPPSLTLFSLPGNTRQSGDA